MAWFKKKADPIADRAKALNAEIAALEAKIRKYESQVDPAPTGPRLRSSTADTPRPTSPPAAAEPVFEKVDTARLMKPQEPATTPAHFNEFGARKYDLPALLQKMRELFRGPTTSNPKLVSYLAAGGIQGMQPLRRERRIARNRFIALVILLFFVLLGLVAVFLGGR
jgi:hypothetical protein